MSRYPGGRTMHDAAIAGDWFQIERADGHTLAMPGCGGVEETLAAARRHWRVHLGARVTLRLVLPGSVIGCMRLGEAIASRL